MSKQMDDLMQAAAADLMQVGAKIDALDAALTPALAKEARDTYVRAIEGHQLNTAFIASTLASLLYAKQGLWRDSLNSHIDWAQIRFMAAQSVEEYASVHDTARDAVKKAGDIKARDLALLAQVLAADAAYFASEAAGANKKEKERWLETALQDALAAFTANPGSAAGGVNGMKLLSIVCSAADEIQAAGLGKKPKLLDALRKLTALAEANVPMDYVVQGDAQKTEWIRRTLAGLSTRLGDPASAQRRLAGKR